jgi:hypothetical protein
LRDPQIMFFRLASATAFLAASSIVAAPVAAANIPHLSTRPVAWAPGGVEVNAQNHRWHRRDRIDGGDVLAGVLVLGTIAAVASAASSKRDRQYRYPQRYPAPDARYDYRNRPLGSRYEGDRGLDRAVDACAREVARAGMVDSVDGVYRIADGWRVSGRLSTGAQFNCSVGSDGRIYAIDYDGRAASSDEQWDDDRYAAARADHDRAVAPAYPGGPLPGDDVEDGGLRTSPDFDE